MIASLECWNGSTLDKLNILDLRIQALENKRDRLREEFIKALDNMDRHEEDTPLHVYYRMLSFDIMGMQSEVTSKVIELANELAELKK